LPAWTNAKGVASDGLGFASYLAMVDADRGAALVARTKALHVGSSSPGSTPAGRAAHEFRNASGRGEAPLAKWWTPAAPPAPAIEIVAKPKPLEESDQPTVTHSTTSVPHVQRGLSPELGNATTASSAGEAPSLLKAIVWSLATLLLLALPGIGPLLVGLGLWWIWRKYYFASKHR
jgi:hypothetical protein